MKQTVAEVSNGGVRFIKGLTPAEEKAASKPRLNFFPQTGELANQLVPVILGMFLSLLVILIIVRRHKKRKFRRN